VPAPKPCFFVLFTHSVKVITTLYFTCRVSQVSITDYG
jgi:hypothetical protein